MTALPMVTTVVDIFRVTDHCPSKLTLKSLSPHPHPSVVSKIHDRSIFHFSRKDTFFVSFSDFSYSAVQYLALKCSQHSWNLVATNSSLKRSKGSRSNCTLDFVEHEFVLF